MSGAVQPLPPHALAHGTKLINQMYTDPEDAARLCIYVDLVAMQHAGTLRSMAEIHRLVVQNFANSIERATGINVPLYGKGEDFSNDLVVRACDNALFQLSLPLQQARSIIKYCCELKVYEEMALRGEC